MFFLFSMFFLYYVCVCFLLFFVVWFHYFTIGGFNSCLVYNKASSVMRDDDPSCTRTRTSFVLELYEWVACIGASTGHVALSMVLRWVRIHVDTAASREERSGAACGDSGSPWDKSEPSSAARTLRYTGKM